MHTSANYRPVFPQEIKGNMSLVGSALSKCCQGVLSRNYHVQTTHEDSRKRVSSSPGYLTQPRQADYNFSAGLRSSSGQPHAVGCIQISYWTVQGKQGRFRGGGHNEPAVSGRCFFPPGLSWMDFLCVLAFESDLMFNWTLHFEINNADDGFVFAGQLQKLPKTVMIPKRV